MTGDDSMSDDVFEMEEDTSAALSTGLTPLMGQPITTPSPTGYRDYKPPAEVLDNNYGYSSRDYNDIRSSFKRTKEDDSALTHKVSFTKEIKYIYRMMDFYYKRISNGTRVFFDWKTDSNR